MGPTTTGSVWPSLLIGFAGLAVALVASLGLASRAVRGGAARWRAPVIQGIDRARVLVQARWAQGVAGLAVLVTVVGVAVVCGVTLGLGELTKRGVVIRADRPVYRFFLHHRQGWLTGPLSWATHIGEYPEMTAIALAGAIVIGFELPRFRVLLTVLLTAAFIPLLLGIGYAYNWADVAALAAFAVAAVVLRRQSFVLAAVLLAAMPVEKHLQSWVSRTLHGSAPAAADAVGGVGLFPSGGCTRIVIICGLVGYLLARGYRSPRMSVGIGVGCVLIGYFEGFTRIYLGKHWFVDCLGGLFFGSALLAVFITALRAALGPVPARGTAAPAAPAARSALGV